MVVLYLLNFLLISMVSAFVSTATSNRNSLLRHQLSTGIVPENLPSMQIRKKAAPKENPSSVISLHSDPHLDAWSKLSSEVWNHPDGCIRFEHEFKPEDSFMNVAKQAVQHIHPWFEDVDDEDIDEDRLHDILDGIWAFTAFCKKNLNHIEGYYLKVSVMHGESATQCRFWHTDNVPVRYMQTLLGPGSMYINPKSYNGFEKPIIANEPPSEGSEQRDWKEQLVKSTGIVPCQTELGQAVMLVGYRWPDVAKSDSNRPPVLHRSPLDVKDGRVLIVMDVLVNKEEKSCNKECCGKVKQ